ncbi:c(7)-type cytochrome triheme domain-containing protein [Motiliproteus sediminis]|uniref:c(7)-type cytochrome triheme domain-containing protein n=1 Tax=Motiliproteus sediminis TaxID=1468178 RepID=UPI001AEF5B6C|nr:c(7)-type cytochrome triheme domain-containing protein [Motiliproteus sediminis]
MIVGRISRAGLVSLVGMALLALSLSSGAEEGKKKERWKRFENDGLHDPGNPAIGELQWPGDAFEGFPMDNPDTGNQVDWVRALESGVIVPRTNLFPDTHIEVLDLDIIMDQTSTMPYVRFPHRAHTQWLDCSNCHDHLFVKKSGANPVNMFAILSGEYCGRCHGAVAFPLTECRRCHSVERNSFRGNFGAQEGPGRVYPPVMEQEVVN